MFTYWHVSLKLQISAIPTYLKISNSTTSGKYSIDDVGDFIFSVTFVTASLRSCWARVFLLTNAFPRDWAFTKYFSFSSLQLRCHLVKFLRQEAHKHASLHDTSTSKQFFTSSTIFSTTVCQRDEDLQQQTLHFFWEAIGTSTVTFKGPYLALLSLIKFPATTRAVHFNAHAYFFKYSSDRWKRWSSSLSCPPETLVVKENADLTTQRNVIWLI